MTEELCDHCGEEGMCSCYFKEQVCTICKESKILKFFTYRKARRKYETQCKACRVKRKSDHYHSDAEFRSNKKAYSRDRYHNVPGVKEQKNEGDRRHYHENSEWANERRRRNLAKQKGLAA